MMTLPSSLSRRRSPIALLHIVMLLMIGILQIPSACSFRSPLVTTQRHFYRNSWIRCDARSRRRRGENEYDEDSSATSRTEIPQLPATGSSSFTSSGHVYAAPSNSTASFVSRKFELQYTCKVCETRNCHMVSRIAYNSGVVIAQCKGCDSRHVIADNLGWTDHPGGFEGSTNTIEEYFENNGLDDNVSRVSQEVFDLEKILQHDTKSGSIVGDDGKPVME